MKKKKMKTTIYSFVTIVTVLLLISGYKVINEHQSKEFLIVELKIKEAANECYIKNECVDKITLQDLYDKGYLEKLFNPGTKEELDSKMCIERINHVIVFCN